MEAKIRLINLVISAYFEEYKSEYTIPAKDMMPYFIQAGIFTKDEKNGLPIRKLLRALDKNNQLSLIPYVYADRKAVNTNWYFQRTKGAAIAPKTKKKFVQNDESNKQKKTVSKHRDEDYVLDLCDEVLKVMGSRQHKFDFLLGDSGRRLPVDIYYPTLNLVIEYREYQHSNEVIFFDKPDKITVSGVSRGEQRKIYDQRRRDVLPKQCIQLIEIDYCDFSYDSKNRIIRDNAKDLEVVKSLLKVSE